MTETPDPKQLPTVSRPGSQESAKSPDPKPQIDGYKIIDRLGEGGMGTVWRAVQLSTHRKVALKVMKLRLFGSKKAQARFEREVELAASLEHPNIARIYESGLHQGIYYYAMELEEGEDLDHYFQGHKPTQREIIETFHKVCEAVQHAHQRGVIHRDLKPSNIIVTGGGQPHVLDFGLAKAYLESEKGQEISIDGDVFGTPAYMSPEQAGGHVDAIDTRTDVYSLGVILFKVLTNQWPYDVDGSYYEVLKNIQEQDPIRPSKIIPHFDADLEAILLKALAKEPNTRYQSAVELAGDLHCWLQGRPVTAQPVDSVYLVRKFVQRNRVLVGGVLLVLFVLTAGIVVSTLFAIGQSRARVKADQMLVEKEEQRQKAVALRLAAQSELTRTRQPESLQLSVLLAVESVKRSPSFEGALALHRSLVLLPQYVAHMKHESAVCCAAFSPDGKYLATESYPATRIWEAATGKEVARMNHEYHVRVITFSPDGTYIVTGSVDGVARLWRAATGEEVTRMTHENPPDSTVMHPSDVCSLAFSPDGRYLATASGDGTARVWETTSGKEVARMTHKHPVYSVTFSPYGRYVASAGFDGTARVWEATVGKEIACFKHHSAVECVAFSPDGRHLATGSRDTTACVWEIMSGAEVARMNHGDEVYYVAFSPDGKNLATISGETLRVWETSNGQEVIRMGQSRTKQPAVFSPDGKHITTIDNDENTALVWEVSRGQEVARMDHLHNQKYCVAFSPDGEYLATGSRDGLRVWKATGGEEVMRCVNEHQGAFSVVFSPSGKYIATGSYDGTLAVWEASTGKEVAQMSHNHDRRAVESVVFSPDGEHLATGGHDQMVRVWEASTGKEVARISHERSVMDVAFSPDGRYLATAGMGTVRVWEVSTNREVYRIDHVRSQVHSVAFSPDGKYLASGSGDGTARVWEASSGKEVAKLYHYGRVHSVAFSPDGEYLATASSGCKTRVWEIANGDEIARIDHPDRVYSVAFSPDGKYLATGGRGIARVYLWRPQDLIADGCSRLARNMTYEEWQRTFRMNPIPYSKTCRKLPVHPSFIEAGRDLARSGDVETALSIFRRALELEPGLDLDPEAEVRRSQR